MDFFRVMAVTVILVFAGPVTVYGVGWLLATHIDGTVMVDNPDRAPEMFCDDGSESALYDDEACNEPAQVEKNVDEPLWSAIEELAGTALLGFPFVLLGVGLLLHAGSWLAGGENGAFPSFAVAAWGLLPSLVGIVIMFGVLALWLEPHTVTPDSSPATALDPVMTQLQALRRVTPIVTFLTAAWSAVIWKFGLEEYRGIDGTSAGFVAVTAGLIMALVGVL